MELSSPRLKNFLYFIEVLLQEIEPLALCLKNFLSSKNKKHHSEKIYNSSKKSSPATPL